MQDADYMAGWSSCRGFSPVLFLIEFLLSHNTNENMFRLPSLTESHLNVRLQPLWYSLIKPGNPPSCEQLWDKPLFNHRWSTVDQVSILMFHFICPAVVTKHWNVWGAISLRNVARLLILAVCCCSSRWFPASRLDERKMLAAASPPRSGHSDLV